MYRDLDYSFCLKGIVYRNCSWTKLVVGCTSIASCVRWNCNLCGYICREDFIQAKKVPMAAG